MKDLLIPLTRTFKPLHHSENGQLVLLVAGVMVVMVGFAALAVDIGFITHTRRGAQNDVDAMALAAVRELPDEDSAKDIAYEWALKNEVDVNGGEVQDILFDTTCSGAAVDDTVTVKLKRNQSTFFARIFGRSSQDLNVCATARTGVGYAGDELLPFGFLEEDPFPTSEDPNDPDVCYLNEADGTQNPDLWGQLCLVKVPRPQDSYFPGSGNSGPLRFDEGEPSGANNFDGDCSPGSSGSDEYGENIEEGSECYYADGDEVRPKPGVNKGKTCSGVGDRVSGSEEDTFEDVFGEPTGGVYREVDTTSGRYGLMPIVKPFGNGSSSTTKIVGFITVYIVAYCDVPDVTGMIDAEAGCQDAANTTCVLVLPVRSHIFEAGVPFAGGSLGEETNALRTIKLVE